MEIIKKYNDYRIKIEKHAMQKIRPSIDDIYDNLKINEKIENGKKIFNIPNNFFTKFKIDNGSNDINDLYKSAIMKWGQVIINRKKNLNQIIENMDQEELKSELKIVQISKKLGEKYPKKYPDEWEYMRVKKRRIKDCDKWNYVFNSLEFYLCKNINVDICKPKHIDQKIWHIIAGAKFFGIPKDRILKCRGILLDNYFPTINETLQIQINELTTLEDIKYIWPKIFKKQIAYRWGAGEKKLNIHSKKKGKIKYPNSERNKTAYEIKNENPEFTRKKIKNELWKRGFETDFEIPYITVIIRKHRKLINKTN